MVSKIKFYRYKVIFLLSICLLQSLSAISLDGRMVPGHIESRHPLKNGNYVRGMIVFKDGITAESDANIILDMPAGILNGNIVTADSVTPPTLHLEGDLVLGCTAGFKGPFILKGRGNSLTLTGSQEILASSDGSPSLHITGDMVINGKGHTMHFRSGAYIAVDENVTVTLRNLTITHDASSPTGNLLVAPLSSAASIVLDNVAIHLTNDWLIKSGRWFVHHDVAITGTSKLSYTTSGSMLIASRSSLTFDLNTTFSYDPPIALGKQLLSMVDRTSRLFLNGADIYTTHTGLQLTKGTLLVDNIVTLHNVGGQSLSQAIIFGDGTTSHDLTIAVQPSGSLVLGSGLLDYQNTN